MENLRQHVSTTDYANQFSQLLLEVPGMHPTDAIYRFVRGLEPQVRLHVELQRAHHHQCRYHLGTGSRLITLPGTR